jgi:hypothetical protein
VIRLDLEELDLDDATLESKDVFSVDWYGRNDLEESHPPLDGVVEPSGVTSMRLGRDLNCARWMTVGSS